MTVLAALVLGTTLSAFASDTAHVMVEADAAFRRIDYHAALSAYLVAFQESPENTEGLWKLARIHVLMAEVATGEDQGELLKQAEAYARLCISLDSTVSDGYTWLAASLGYQALAAGSAKKLEFAQGLLEESAMAIELNPNDDVAYSIRGSFFRALGNASWFEKGIAQLFFGDVPDGGYEESEAALQHALLLAPEIMRHHYELGVLYIDMGRDEEAEAALRHAQSLPVRIASDWPRLETIRELLESEFPKRPDIPRTGDGE
jgi:tetratricopeptide (TPR) repeat protein